MPIELNSSIYEGFVQHRRYEPVHNAFRYRVFFAYLDLDELPGLLDGAWWCSARRPALAWFRRADYHGPRALPLAHAVRDTVERVTGRRPAGPIRLLTHLRYWGYCFNPVSMYYCFDAAGARVETIMAEITNTPWKERRALVFDECHNQSRGPVRRFLFRKDFHVSPFMPMDVSYDWRFTEPGAKCLVHMKDLREGRVVFDATLSLQRRPMTRATLRNCLARYPFMTLQIVTKIHYQALRLWRKGARFHPHPKHDEHLRALHRPGAAPPQFIIGHDGEGSHD